eukprot:TRINITY_DN3738_c0_g1_i2.p1 TRINITY_DN3738_c0_g1~~TRINITY_DN3738_c0_g1_i2.p1  ORF type:complete len:330 (+),score=106.10 TRINITY_DN3738_c0_g1_i2:86-1075(+)
MRHPQRSTLSSSSAASDVYKRQMGCGGSKDNVKAPPSAASINAEDGLPGSPRSSAPSDDEFLQSLPDRLKDIPELEPEEKLRISEIKAEMDQTWVVLDADGTGELAADQLDSLVLWILEQFSDVVGTDEVRAETETMLHNIVRKHVDRDQDGKVQKQEFMTYFSKLAPSMMRIRKHHKLLLAAKDEAAAAEEQRESEPMSEREWLAIELPEYDPDTAPVLEAGEEADILVHTVRNQRYLKKLRPEVPEEEEIDGALLEKLIGYAWKHVHLSQHPTNMELQAELIKVLKRADQNRNGALDWHEFRTYFESTATAYARFRKQQKGNQSAST